MTRPSRYANQADGNSAVAIEALRNIRDKSAFSSRGTGKGALVEESYAVFNAVEHGLPLAEVGSGVLDGKLFQKKSIATRRSIWMALRHRYLTADPYVVRSLANATQYGAQSLEYKSLGYLYYALRDRAVFELVTGPIWERWRSGSSSLDPSDFISFVEDLSAEHPSVKQWRESTKIRLGRNIFAALRDFGLLVGTQKKSIQQPGVSQETLFHLLSILDAEGLRGGSLLAARDWRLFLLTETQVVGHMVELARNGWIRRKIRTRRNSGDAAEFGDRMTDVDWGWKLREAVERIKTAYAHIGRSSGAPILAIVYPPDQEIAVLKEWHTLTASLGSSFDVRTIDALEMTSLAVQEFGVEAIVANLADPMPGSDPNAELGRYWVRAVAARIHELTGPASVDSVPLVVIERLAALYPVAGPRAVMQAVWDTERASLDTVVVFLIPGTLLQPRVYRFVNRQEEFMYRGDIL